MQRLNIGDTQATHRPSKHAQRRSGVLWPHQKRGHRHEILDLRLPEKSTEAKDLVGHADLIQSSGDQRRLLIGAHENGGTEILAFRRGLIEPAEVLSDERALLILRSEVTQLYLASRCGGLGRQLIYWALARA